MKRSLTTRMMFAAVLACFAVSAAQAQTTMSVEAARGLAFSLAANGQPAQARSVALQLLERDPDDVAALIALSQAEQALGNTRKAIQTGQRAWAKSSTGSQRHAAAVATAQALVNNGNGLRAQFWLRRAIETAPTETTKRNALRDLQNVRAVSPVTASLNFSISPSSNINNGSKSDRADIGGLSFQLSGDAQALSGVEYRFGGTFGYRTAVTDRHTLNFGIALDTRSYSLSSEAKALAPGTSGSDFAFQELRTSVVSLRRDKDGSAVTQIGVGLAQNWYAGNALTRIVSVSAARSFQLTPRSAMNVGLAGERQKRLDSSERSATIVSLNSGWTHRLQNGAGLSLQGFVRDTTSASPSIAKFSYGTSLSYRLAEPIFGQTQLQLSLGLERQDYDRPEPLFGLRDDVKINLSARFAFNDLNYYGFAPTAEIILERNRSNQNLYDTQEVGVRLGLQSVF